MSQKTMTLTEWQGQVRERTSSVLAGRRAQPLALLNRRVECNPEPWMALHSRAIPFATACFLQLKRGHGEVNGTTHIRLTHMVRHIDSLADEWRGETAMRYRELRRLIAEVDPESLPARDEMDHRHQPHGQ